MKAPLCCLLLAALAARAAAFAKAGAKGGPRRLLLDGSRLIDPEGRELRLTGFNMNTISRSAVEGDGKLMQQTVPGANLARLVSIKWGNDCPLDGSNECSYKSECMQNDPPYIKESCFTRGGGKAVDEAIRRATTDTGGDVWVILAVRGKCAAGGCGGMNLWDDKKTRNGKTLAEMFAVMWRHVAARYKGWDNIAGYELLAEPRIQFGSRSDAVSFQKRLTDFYATLCRVTQSEDRGAACVVGPASYYNINLFNEGLLMPPGLPVIYTFDYFQPEAYIFTGGAVKSYPGRGLCGDLYKGWFDYHTSECASRQTEIAFDKEWHRRYLQGPQRLATTHDVPVLLNQWDIQHGISAAAGRYAYISDVAELLQEMGISWAWWTWRGDADWKDSATKILASDGSVDSDVVKALAPYMSDKDPSGGAPSPKPSPDPSPTSPTPPAPAPPAQCTDSTPSWDSNTCAQRQTWGGCSANYMKGHCCKTCFGCVDGCGK